MAGLHTIRFTVAALDRLESPTKGYVIYKDEKCIYLKLYVTAGGVKSFFVRTRINGKDERIVLGRFPVISIEQARKLAITNIAQASQGKHPLAKKRKQMESRITFWKHFHDYLERYSKPHKKTWAEDKRDIEKHLSHWFKRDLSEIRKADVQKLVEKLYAESGLYQANKILIRIRAIFNKAIEWGWQGINPTNGIKKYREKSRDRFVQKQEMPFLLKALDEIENTNARDFLLMLFMTGVRKKNLTEMRWQEIDMLRAEWRIPMTKNGEPVLIPLTQRAVNLLQDRFSKAQRAYVFPHPNDPTRHILGIEQEWKSVLAKATMLRWMTDASVTRWLEGLQNCHQMPQGGVERVKWLQGQAAKSSVILPPSMLDLRLHDIRRTFGSYQAMTGASLLTIGKSLGHRSTAATQVYARLNDQSVRESVEKATEAMFE